MKFYERFESLIKERGLTVAEVSRATGIPYTTLDSYVKKKQSYTSMENNIKLAEYFGVSMEWLATGKVIAEDGMTLELSPLNRRYKHSNPFILAAYRANTAVIFFEKSEKIFAKSVDNVHTIGVQ